MIFNYFCSISLRQPEVLDEKMLESLLANTLLLSGCWQYHVLLLAINHIEVTALFTPGNCPIVFRMIRASCTDYVYLNT